MTAPRVIAAVQVRMGSTRLPGKVMADLGGRPTVGVIVERLRHARRLADVVIATSDEPRDAAVRDFAVSEGVPCFAGSEADLIDRLYGTARHFAADALVRITGDCPLVDPRLVDEVVTAYAAAGPGVDYASNVLPRTYPIGLDIEVYPLPTLERLWKTLDDPHWREWFPSWLWDHRDQFHIVGVIYPRDLSKLRWTVDYPEDLQFVRAVYQRLYREGEVFGMEDILELLDVAPELAAINAQYADA